MKANDFDDDGSVTPFADMPQARRSNLKTKRVNMDFPAWMAEALGKEATHLGVSHQAPVKA